MAWVKVRRNRHALDDSRVGPHASQRSSDSEGADARLTGDDVRELVGHHGVRKPGLLQVDLASPRFGDVGLGGTHQAPLLLGVAEYIYPYRSLPGQIKEALHL